MLNRNRVILIPLFLIGTLSALQILPPAQIISNQEKQQYKKAISLERSKHFDQAINIYQSILESNPKNNSVYRRLGFLLRRLEKYSELETLIQNHLSQFPNDMQSHINLGETYYLQNKKQEALSYWSDIKNQYSYSKTIYRLLMHVFVKHYLDEQLDQLISEARNRFNDQSLFSNDLGRIFFQKQDYKRATNEFTTYIIHYPKKSSFAISHLLRIADKPDGLPIVEQILLSRLNEDTTTIKSLLSNVYFSTRHYSKAFQEHLTIGTKNNSDLQRWLQFANNLRNEKQYDLALEAFSTILSSLQARQTHDTLRYPIQSPISSPIPSGQAGQARAPYRAGRAGVNSTSLRKITGEALYGLALTYEKQIIPLQTHPSLVEYYPNNIFFEDHFYGVPTVEVKPLEETFTLYDSILVKMPSSTFSPQAHFRLGEIKYRITEDFDSAIKSYESATSRSRDNNLIRDSNVRIGDVLIAKGDLTAALDFINNLLTVTRNPKQKKIYQLKKCHVLLLSGKVDSTQILLGNLIGSLDIVDEHLNDVLELRGFIEENYNRASKDGKKAFSFYLMGEHLLRQHKLTEAKSFFSEILQQYPTTMIADEATFRKAKIQVLLGKYNSAISELMAFQDFPMGDKVATFIGEIYDFYLNNREMSLQWYLKVLEEYPESMLVEPVRYRIRELSRGVTGGEG